MVRQIVVPFAVKNVDDLDFGHGESQNGWVMVSDAMDYPDQDGVMVSQITKMPEDVYDSLYEAYDDGKMSEEEFQKAIEQYNTKVYVVNEHVYAESIGRVDNAVFAEDENSLIEFCKDMSIECKIMKNTPVCGG